MRAQVGALSFGGIAACIFRRRRVRQAGQQLRFDTGPAEGLGAGGGGTDQGEARRPATITRRAEVVGPQSFAGVCFGAGVWATILAVIAIAAWVAVRFEWQYGIGAGRGDRA